MAQQFQTSRSKVGGAQVFDRRWLAGLIDAMEQATRPDVRNAPCDPEVISALAAHLARPVCAFPQYGSAYSLRN
jgi:hypothetical protein